MLKIPKITQMHQKYTFWIFFIFFAIFGLFFWKILEKCGQQLGYNSYFICYLFYLR
jgi:DMSO reductase anchor subunit